MNKPLFQPIKIDELNSARDAMDVENHERRDVGLSCTALNIDMQNDVEVRDWVLTGETWYSKSGLLGYGIEIGMRIMHARQEQAQKVLNDVRANGMNDLNTRLHELYEAALPPFVHPVQV